MGCWNPGGHVQQAEVKDDLEFEVEEFRRVVGWRYQEVGRPEEG